MFDDRPAPALPPGSRLDDEVRDRGLRQLAELRARHGWVRPGGAGDVTPPAATPGADPGPAGVGELSLFDDTDRIAAEMAAGALRERLEHRIAELEAENARLRAAFAAAMRALASGLGPVGATGDADIAAGDAGRT